MPLHAHQLAILIEVHRCRTGIRIHFNVLLRQLSANANIPGAMLERDDRYPPEAELNGELDAIRDALGAANLSSPPNV